MRVRWLRTALDNLSSEAEYISDENPVAAGEMVECVLQAVSRLANYPMMGRPGRVRGTRELVVPRTPYIVPYRIRGDTVEVLRVFHGSRKWPKRL